MPICIAQSRTCVKGIIPHKFTRTNDFNCLSALLCHFFSLLGLPLKLRRNLVDPPNFLSGARRKAQFDHPAILAGVSVFVNILHCLLSDRKLPIIRSTARVTAAIIPGNALRSDPTQSHGDGGRLRPALCRRSPFGRCDVGKSEGWRSARCAAWWSRPGLRHFGAGWGIGETMRSRARGRGDRNP
jgi:hypothetical protein